MGNCGDCEHLTKRHCCSKYKKRLAYSSFSSSWVSASRHERCSECDKDYRIAELEERLKSNSGLSPTDPDDSIRCGQCGSDISIDVEYKYCPYCGAERL